MLLDFLLILRWNLQNFRFNFCFSSSRRPDLCGQTVCARLRERKSGLEHKSAPTPDYVTSVDADEIEDDLLLFHWSLLFREDVKPYDKLLHFFDLNEQSFFFLSFSDFRNSHTFTETTVRGKVKKFPVSWL